MLISYPETLLNLLIRSKKFYGWLFRIFLSVGSYHLQKIIIFLFLFQFRFPLFSLFFKLRKYYNTLIGDLANTEQGYISVQFIHSVVFDSLWPHEPQYARPPCPSPIPGAHPNPCPLSRWCHPTISSSVVPFSSCPQSFPASGSFPVIQLSASGGQSIGVSASKSVLSMITQDWSPLG